MGRYDYNPPVRRVGVVMNLGAGVRGLGESVDHKAKIGVFVEEKGVCFSN